jgi:hypothetical protein
MKVFSQFIVTAALLVTSAHLASAAVLISEDFEGLTLAPFESPTESGGDGTDWTSELPTGWTMTYSGPVGSPIEFQGWHVMDVDSWIATEEDQERSTWGSGGVGERGSVLVADPDAYDDGTEIDTALFNTWVNTPILDLSTLVAGTANITFDSFWRNEVTQIGQLEVSYDGGTSWNPLLTYDSAVLVDGEVIDEQIDLAVDNPASGNMLFRFGLTDASNDWWWGIDNVTVSATLIPEPSTIALGVVGAALMALAVRRSKRNG